MKRNLKILHTADLHLGSPFSFLEPAKQKVMNSEQEKVFFQIIDFCRKERVNFLTIGGDLFDSSNPDKHLLDRVYQGFSAIPQVKIIINPGNHDYWHQAGFWQSFYDLQHVFVFEPQTECFRFDDQKIRFYGKPFISQSSPSPLWQGIDLKLDSVYFNILLQHGDLQSSNSPSNYNPLNMSWFDRCGFDLVLLGHIHKSDKEIHTAEGIPCLYSGCPSGRGFDEDGSKGVFLLELIETSEVGKISFIPLAGPKFFKIRLDITQIDFDTQLELHEKILITLEKRISAYRIRSNYDCCQLKLVGYLSQKINRELLLTKLKTMFFYVELVDETKMMIDFASLMEEHSLRGDVTRYAKRLATGPDLLNKVLEELGLSDLNVEQAKQVIEQGYYFTMQAAEQDLDIYED
ncbi:MAG: DNA repair exonuclease [Clostridiaceae bacterium]|nr:DNA repair exonuclease [Clostridiaceae bacterium]